MALISCTIDHIHFSFQKSDNFYALTETSNGVSHDASMEREVLIWLRDETKKINAESDVGHLGRFKSPDSTTSLSIRRCSIGLFAALMIVDKRAENKITTLCIPLGKKGSGITSFSSFIEKALSMDSDNHHVKTKTSLFQSEEEAMKATCVVATFSSDSYDWNLLPGDLLDMFDIVKAPSIEPIGGSAFLLTFNSSKEVDLIMFSKEMILWDCKVSFEKWNPGMGTLPNSTLQESNRWITMHGLPCHLRNKFFILKLCKDFGRVTDIKPTRGRFSHLTALQVCLEHCNLTLMPQIIPIKDKGVVFPVSLSPFMPEFKCIAEEHAQEKVKERPTNVELPVSQLAKVRDVCLDLKKNNVSSSTNVRPIHQNPKIKTRIGKQPVNNTNLSSASTEPTFYHKPTPSYSPRFPKHVTTHSPPNHHTIDSSTEGEDDQEVSFDTNSQYQDSFDDGISSNSDMVQLASTLGMSLQAADHVFKKMVELKRDLLSEMDAKINKGMEDLIEALGTRGVNA